MLTTRAIETEGSIPPHILIVDDEQAITSALAVLFQGSGYKTTVAQSSKEALKLLFIQKPDLIVLDIVMPELDGYTLCRKIREQKEYIPILMLTAKDESWEKVTGLELGADVYLTKPFESGELLAQTKALLRLVGGKRQGTAERPLTCGPLTLWMQQHRLYFQDLELELTPKEFELLAFFMQHPGQAFGRETLLRQVWGYDYPNDSRTVDTHVRRLRTKIEENPNDPQLLQTIHGFGYRLIDTSL